MRYRFLILLGLVPLLAISQNPLKRELKGNTTSMHYSPSQFSFTNQNNANVQILDLKDRRSLNWNKQVNDSVKIEAIGDYWNFPISILFKNKISQDFNKANVAIDFAGNDENAIKIEPTLEVLYPNFVSFPDKGYLVLSRINMQVSKGTQTLFNKSYQEYTLFDKSINGYKESFNSDLKEGANVAMWTSLKRLLDQFYSDLNDVFAGKTVKSTDVGLNNLSASNIANDANLNTQVTNYSNNKNIKETNSNNYKLEGDVPPPPPPTDRKLDNAVNVLGTEPKLSATVSKPAKMPIIDSAKLVERRQREELRKKAIDSAKKAREELALTAKKMEQEEKGKLQFKRDSILKVKKDAIALKVREKFVADSIKKSEINKKIDEAKEITRKKRSETTNTTTENNATKPKNDKPAVERTKPQSIARKPSRKVANESIGDAVRRIAEEIEYEENTLEGDRKESSQKITTVEPRDNKRAEEFGRLKAEREKALEELNAKKAERNSKIASEKQKKQDSLLSIRKAKAEAIEASMARAKAVKDSIAEVMALKRYYDDSVKLIKEKEKRREIVMAAQKAAMQAEQNVLLKNPSAGEMFPVVSSDPPSKMPDSRTREQILADRIFTPKSETTKNLLARVKLITPEEEARLLAQMKTDDKSVADSFFIQIQKNRPIPTYTPIDTTQPNLPKVEDSKSSKQVSKEDKKSQIIEKGLKGGATSKDSKDAKSIETVTKKAIEKKGNQPATESTPLNKSASKTPTTTKKESKTNDISSAPAQSKVDPPNLDSAQAEKKAQDLEAEIEKKKKEINERLKKAKSW